MHSTRMEVRKAILRLTNIGDTANVGGDIEVIKDEAKAFTAKRKLRVFVEPTAGGARLTRFESDVAPTPYPQIAMLTKGESVVISEHPARHASVRNAASRLAAAKGSRYSCRRVLDDIVVTRTDGTPEGAKTVPRSRYDLDRLAYTNPLMFGPLTPGEQCSLRVAVSKKAQQQGWNLTCRADGNLMRVYRLDLPGAEIEPPPGRRGRETGSKYNLGRLATQRTILFDLPPTQHQAVRNAASQMGMRRGWTLRCRVDDAGGIRVTRTDAGAPANDDAPPAPPTPPAPPAATPATTAPAPQADEPEADDTTLPFEFTPEQIAEFQRQRDLELLSRDGWYD